jgi:pyridoxamine 5'-phosphate oxidase
MTVATIGLDGFPKSRVVLLKKFNEEGFIFYTNYNSEKGKAIVNNPNICLSFFWTSLERQVIIKGIAEKTIEAVSDNYFASRPDGSKLGAIVSPQSEVIPNREFLESNLKKLEQDYQNIEIERPKHWGGFLVRPVEVEFWQGRANRLHDRIRYQLRSDFNWKIDRLAP